MGMNPELGWLGAAAVLLVELPRGGMPAIGMLAVPLLSLVIYPVIAVMLLLHIYVISDIPISA